MEEVVRVQDSGAIQPDALIDALKALANPVRLEIVQWLRDPEAAFADYEPIADRAEVGACAVDDLLLHGNPRARRPRPPHPCGQVDALPTRRRPHAPRGRRHRFLVVIFTYRGL
jgi:hypothetical protein